MNKDDKPKSDEELEEAARKDPDNLPLTEEQLERLSRNIPSTRYIRRRLKMSPDEFADAFGLSRGTVRDWEQGRCEPDDAAQALLRIIAQDPEGVLSLAQRAKPAATQK